MGIGKKISEARKIAQVPRFARSIDWYGKYFVRFFSIYISYILAKLGIPANFVTVLMGVMALCGSLFMIPHNIRCNLVGAVLWQLWYILDRVDGEVARLLNKTSMLGIYLDRVSHIIANSTFVLALGLHVYFLEPTTFNLIIAIAIYSAWHWKREIPHLVNTTLVVEAGFKKDDFIVKRKRSVAMIRYILARPFGEVEAMLLLTAIILLSHTLGIGFVKWSLYVYTVLILAYVGVIILRHSRQIYRKEHPK